MLVGRYNISLEDLPENDDMTAGCLKGFELLERIGRKRGFLISGGPSARRRLYWTNSVRAN